MILHSPMVHGVKSVRLEWPDIFLVFATMNLLSRLLNRFAMANTNYVVMGIR